jgi:hypothetical protein
MPFFRVRMKSETGGKWIDCWWGTPRELIPVVQSIDDEVPSPRVNCRLTLAQAKEGLAIARAKCTNRTYRIKMYEGEPDESLRTDCQAGGVPLRS